MFLYQYFKTSYICLGNIVKYQVDFKNLGNNTEVGRTIIHYTYLKIFFQKIKVRISKNDLNKFSNAKVKYEGLFELETTICH